MTRIPLEGGARHLSPCGSLKKAAARRIFIILKMLLRHALCWCKDKLTKVGENRFEGKLSSEEDVPK